MKLSALFVSLALLSTAAFAQMVDMVDMGNVDLNSVQIVDDNVAWAAGYDNDASASVFYVTTDAGDNWTKTTGNIGDEFWVHIAPVDADNAVAFATTSIHYTTDGGATWTEAVNDGGAFFNGGEMIDADNGFVVGDSKDAANWDIPPNHRRRRDVDRGNRRARRRVLGHRSRRVLARREQRLVFDVGNRSRENDRRRFDVDDPQQRHPLVAHARP